MIKLDIGVTVLSQSHVQTWITDQARRAAAPGPQTPKSLNSQHVNWFLESQMCYQCDKLTPPRSV